VLIVVGVIGVTLAACSGPGPKASHSSTTTSATVPTTTSTSVPADESSLAAKIGALSSLLKKADKATYKAQYAIVNGSTTQMLTIEQSPPKSVFTTKGDRVIDTGKTTYYCTTSGKATCVSSKTTNPLASLEAVFSAASVLAELQAGQAQADAHVAGYNITFTSGSYAGQSASCANLSTSAESVKYCVTQQGIVAFVSSLSATFTLTSYSSSPPASDFALPAGATVTSAP